MTNTVTDGASLSHATPLPSFNLEMLSAHLLKAIQSQTEEGQEPEFVFIHNGKLHINARCIFDSIFSDSDVSSGRAIESFISNAHPPKFGGSCKIGGDTLGSKLASSKNIKLIEKIISQHLDKLIPEDFIKELVSDSSESLILEYNKSLNSRTKPLKSQEALIKPIAFTKEKTNQNDAKNDVATVITSIETIEDKPSIHALTKGISNLLKNLGCDEFEIEDVCDHLQKQAQENGSQIVRFLNFIEDEAMSRVRLHVCIEILKSLASHSKMSGFKSYVSRISECYDRFAGEYGDGFEIDISKSCTMAANSELGQELQKSGFYKCLPVWVQASTQLFESHFNEGSKNSIVREVSYRFKVNGNDPSSGVTAYMNRLDSYEATVLAAQDAILKHEDPISKAPQLKRHAAEIFFLSMVMPPSISEEHTQSLDEYCKDLTNDLLEFPLRRMKKEVRLLKEKSKTADAIAAELINLIKTNAGNIIQLASSAINSIHLSVLDGVINKSALKGMTSHKDKILAEENVSATGDSTSANSGWLQHIRIGSQIRSNSFMSVSITNSIKNRILTVKNQESKIVEIQKISSHPVLPVRIMPFFKNKEGEWLPCKFPYFAFNSKNGIDVQIDYRTIAINNTKDKDPETTRKNKIKRAFSVATQSIFLYIILGEIAKRIEKIHPETHIKIIRIQNEGKSKNSNDDAKNGNTAAYAISQALENLLGRILPTRVQGMTFNSSEGKIQPPNQYQITGTIAAIDGGSPVRVKNQGTLDRVALLTYGTRPCTFHPNTNAASSHQFFSKSYTAISDGEWQTIAPNKNCARIVESQDDFATPHLVLEEIARLRSAGFKHVMLLSHHFGNRHIGRAAERHAPHTTAAFLEKAFTSFPDVHLYPLRRDVFPATRLRQRQIDESGFEITSHADHQLMYEQHASQAQRSLIPIYTFATLHVVVGHSINGATGNQRPQSGFSTYYFDSEHRLSNIESSETARTNILGLAGAKGIRDSMISLLRAIHFLESEKYSIRNSRFFLPVLDPYPWVNPTSNAQASELEVLSTRNGKTLFSLTSLLTHVMHIIQQEPEKHNV